MSIINPKVRIDIIPAYQKAEVQEQKVLFVGQMTTGTAISGQLYTSIESNNQQDILFGKNSMLATMIRNAKKINKISRFDAIPLADEGAAVAAVGNVTFTGTASANGKIYISIGSEKNNTYELDITSAQTETQIGDALAALITADTTSLVAASNAAGVVTLTAVNKGEEGNKIGVKYSGTVAGVTVALTQPTGGTTNPVITTVFDVVGNIRYQTIVWPSTYTLSILQDFLDDRFNAGKRILDGIGILSVTDTLANLKLIPNNSQSIALHGNQLVNDSDWKGSAIFEMDYAIASQFSAIRSLRLTDGASIINYVNATEGAKDAIGGLVISSLPYFNTPFNLLPIVPHKYEWDDDENDELNEAGIFILGDNEAHNKIIADRVVTTYKTDAASNPDISFKYMNYVDTSVGIRWYFHENLRRRFLNSRLTTGDVIPLRNMANAHIIQAALMVFYKDLADMTLIVAGESARKKFLDNLTIEIDMETSTVNIFMVVEIVVQLERINAEMQISFSPNE